MYIFVFFWEKHLFRICYECVLSVFSSFCIVNCAFLSEKRVPAMHIFQIGLLLSPIIFIVLLLSGRFMRDCYNLCILDISTSLNTSLNTKARIGQTAGSARLWEAHLCLEMAANARRMAAGPFCSSSPVARCRGAGVIIGWFFQLVTASALSEPRPRASDQTPDEVYSWAV